MSKDFQSGEHGGVPAGFPVVRMRRLRRTETIRQLVRENSVEPADLIQPYFVCPGTNVKKPISSMPGQYRFSIDMLLFECEELLKAGISTLLLFGIPESKDEIASGAYDENGIIQTAVRAIKEKFPELIIVADLCCCEYTSHGHCGIIRDGNLDNDETLKLLGKIAVSQAQAGTDILAPSAMIDGMVGTIRRSLDAAGFQNRAILSYAVKYSSAFYGPFREAADSAPQFGNRKTYQMDPANAREAVREAELDLAEGADILMVKPGLPYLDVLYTLRRRFNVPLAAYQVSGEYAMIRAAALKNWLDGPAVIKESLISLKRAGADIIITYFAKEAAGLLSE